MSAPLRRQMEQLQVTNFSSPLSISNTTRPQWQLPR
jgi:hypothetical protein